MLEEEGTATAMAFFQLNTRVLKETSEAEAERRWLTDGLGLVW